MNKIVKENREKIAEAFIKSLTEEPETWQKNWRCREMPRNGVTGYKYKGINRLWLSYLQNEKGYDDPRWYTFDQIKKSGWHLKKESKATKVEYWYPYANTSGTALTWQEYYALDEMQREEAQISLRCRYCNVYNAERIEGLPELEKTERREINEAELIGIISSRMGVEILHDGGDRAFYNTGSDQVHLPLKDDFFSDYDYNATALHELSHATGHEKRLNRNLTGLFGTEDYAFEELIAELSSCFISSEELPVDMNEEHFRNHKAYIQGWVARIEKEPEVLMKAVKEAERAANYLELQADLISEKQFTKVAHSTKEVAVSKVEATLPEAIHKKEISVREQAQEAATTEMTAAKYVANGNEPWNKAYVREYISDFLQSYDFRRPVIIQGSSLPSFMMEQGLNRGGMGNTLEECKAFIKADNEAAINTTIYIKDKYPDLGNVTAESDPGRFSLLMMERELYKVFSNIEIIDECWNRDFLFDRSVAKQICEEVGIQPPQSISYNKTKDMEIEL